jgi:phage tail sheath protein FI
VPTSTAAFVDVFAAGPLNSAVAISSFGDFEQKFGGLSAESEASYAVGQFFSNGGTDAFAVRVDDSAGLTRGIIGDPTLGTGMQALLNVEQFNILCVPATMNLAWPEAALIAAAAEKFCAGRRAMYILDPPLDGAPDTVAGIADWTEQNANLCSPDAVLYFPRVLVSDPLSGGKQRKIAASGTMAGVWARNDAARGVWCAPSGEFAKLNGVVDLACKMTEADTARLGSLGINGFRDFFGARPLAWGARTLAGAEATASPWKYIPVRRFALFLEDSIHRGTQWAVFEPNGELLWAEVQDSVGAFMQTLFQQGAFSGRTPQQAYFARCDAETQTTADEGNFTIEIGFAALETAEFTIIRMQQAACRNCA